MESLGDEDPRIAAVAARALGQSGHRNAIPELRKKAFSSQQMVVSEAVRALVRIGGREEALRLARQKSIWSFAAARSLMEVLDGPVEADEASILSVVNRFATAGDRLEALRFLAERDSPVLAAAHMASSEINALYPYLARSRLREVRALVLGAKGEVQGEALAALLLCPRATPDEKEEAANTLGDAWLEAIARGGPPVIAELDKLTLGDSRARAYREPALWPAQFDTPNWLEVLGMLRGPEARKALERVGSAVAIETLMRREDRLHSLAAIQRLKREGSAEVVRQAEVAILAMGAPGSLAVMQRALARPEGLRSLVPALARGPLATEAFKHLARGRDARPDVVVALSSFFQLSPSDFFSLVSVPEPAARRRVYAALALSGAPPSLPVLVDLAVNGEDEVSRRIALRALADEDIRSFAAGLHRSAGDTDRRIRFAAALALVPTGETWAMRLLVSEMDQQSHQEVVAARRAIDRLPQDRARGLLGEMFWDGTGGPFANDLFFELGGEISERRQRPAWERISSELENPYALLVAARLDVPEAAKAVISHLEE
jgi:HEAT repeat protein